MVLVTRVRAMKNVLGRDKRAVIHATEAVVDFPPTKVPVYPIADQPPVALRNQIPTRPRKESQGRARAARSHHHSGHGLGHGAWGLGHQPRSRRVHNPRTSGR